MAGLPPGLEVPPGYEDVEPSPQPHNGASPAWNQGQQTGNQLEDAAEEDIKVTPAQGTIYKAAESFKDLGLHPNLLRGLYDEMNFETPSKIQAQVLPLVLERSYKSLIAQAHNGSGKTTCFVLAMLSRVDPAQRTPQALCLCPTRELVVQNVMVTQKMGRHTGVQVESTADESVMPRRGDKCQAQIVIATHGKLKNWLARDFIPLNHMKILVFDEADQMLAKDGFGQESLRMIKRVQSATTGLQILLFSATFNQAVIDFAKDVVGTEAHQVYVPKEELSLDVIKQYRVEVERPRQKIDVITKMIFPNSEKLGQTIIFVKTRDTARALFTELTRQGHKVTNITGDMEKRDRDNIVDEFRTGKTKILIATDLLARGFDVRSVTLVVNFDAPVVHGSGHNPQPNFETYLHRIGRSGRFGQKGCAFNLVCEPSEKAVVDAIAEHFDKEIPEVKWDDEEAFIHCLEDAGLKSTEDAY